MTLSIQPAQSLVRRGIDACRKMLSRWISPRPRRRRTAHRTYIERLEPRQVLAPMAIGMNLENVVDWSPAWTFTDLFQQSRPWIAHDYNTVTRQRTWAGTRPVQTDANGWVTRLDTWTNSQGQRMEQRVGTLMFRELTSSYPAGLYRAEWDGAGNVVFEMDARVVERGRTADGHHFATLNVTPGMGGIYLGITATDPADPIRNIHVWMPNYNGQSFAGQRWQPGAEFSPFHPLFREQLAPFGVLRFMQWQETNTSDIRTWSDRRDALDSRQQSAGSLGFQNGVALEYMVQLANELDADPWFNMPHMADDDFVRNFATYVRDHLEPDRKAYVEWSNEIWNFAPGFEATFWVRDQTLLPQNQGLSHWQIAGREARRDLDLWTQVYAGQTDRLVRVAGGFAANDWVTARVLENMGNSFDAIAIAPYFAPSAAQRATYTAATTVDQVLTDSRNNLPSTFQMSLNHRRLADQYTGQFGREIRVVAYEGGPHLDGRGAAYQTAFFQAGLDPRMADIYRDYLRGLNATGMDLFVHFNFTGRRMATQWGDFASLHRMDQPLAEAHKYRALLEADAGTLYSSGRAQVSIVAADTSAAEAGRDPAAFRVYRGNGDASQPLTVSYTVSGTAGNGTDYERLSGQVTIAANESFAAITVRPIDDSLVEPMENLRLTLTAGSSYQLLGVGTSVTATLTSDDVAPPVLPTVTVRATDSSAAEAGRDPGMFTITRTGDLRQALTVQFTMSGTARNGGDYDTLLTSVMIAAGQASATVTVRPIDDSEVESTETATLTLAANAAYRLGSATSASVSIADNDRPIARTLPVLIVIANQDFYYREYSETRAELERAGIPVVVAAGLRIMSRPHANSGQGADGGLVMPDVTLAQANARDYSAIVFVGGWGASAYQYAFTGTYQNSAYNGTADIRNRVNQLINDFVSQNKYVTAICHAVSVLAWARVNGQSLLQGRQVAGYNGASPASNVAGATQSRWHVQANGGTQFASGSIGNRATVADDVWIDGRIITAENYDTARRFGQVIAERLLAPSA